MLIKKINVYSTVILLLSTIAGSALAAPDQAALEELGKRVFFDKISNPPRQACVTCHDPANGWTGGVAGTNIHKVGELGADQSGAGQTRGGRKSPSIGYTSFSPEFGDNAPLVQIFGSDCGDMVQGLLCKGGLFWDGRARGDVVGPEVFGGSAQLESAYGAIVNGASALVHQATGPFGNSVELNVIPTAEGVCQHVEGARYAPLFKKAWGTKISCKNSAAAELSFKRIAVAIAAWESGPEVNQFSSKRDRALANERDREFPLKGFTAQENLGHKLFYGKAACSFCHNSAGFSSEGDEPYQLYTDFSYHHLGLPPNYEIANFDPNNPDRGLSEHTSPGVQSGHDGFFQTPTVRNVSKRKGEGFTKAYMHNGYFKNLYQVVHFYNTAGLKVNGVDCPPGTTAKEAIEADCWPEPEINNGLQASRSQFGAPAIIGNLGLTLAEEKALVAYLETLSDTKTVRAPKPYKAETSNSGRQTGRGSRSR